MSISSSFLCIRCLALLFSLPASALAPAVHHPLDALTPAEYWVVYKAIRAAGHTRKRFCSPACCCTSRISPTFWPGRRARRSSARRMWCCTTRATPMRRWLISRPPRWNRIEELKGMQAPFTTTEEQEVNDAIKHDPRIVDALKKRGITDLNLVTCYATPGGYIALPGAGWAAHRLGRMRIQHRRGEWNGRPRSRRAYFLPSTWRARRSRALPITGIAPMPPVSEVYDSDGGPAAAGTKPIVVSQPEGPSFTIKDGEVSWQNWHFPFPHRPAKWPGDQHGLARLPGQAALGAV